MRCFFCYFLVVDVVLYFRHQVPIIKYRKCESPSPFYNYTWKMIIYNTPYQETRSQISGSSAPYHQHLDQKISQTLDKRQHNLDRPWCNTHICIDGSKTRKERYSKHMPCRISWTSRLATSLFTYSYIQRLLKPWSWQQFTGRLVNKLEDRSKRTVKKHICSDIAHLQSLIFDEQPRLFFLFSYSLVR
jgi:hypothetical protein